MLGKSTFFELLLKFVIVDMILVSRPDEYHQVVMTICQN